MSIMMIYDTVQLQVRSYHRTKVMNYFLYFTCIFLSENRQRDTQNGLRTLPLHMESMSIMMIYDPVQLQVRSYHRTKVMNYFLRTDRQTDRRTDRQTQSDL